MRWMTSSVLPTLVWLTATDGSGQQLLVDQASGTLNDTIVNASRTPPDLAQSFTPSLSAVGFVQFRSLATFPSGSTVTLVVDVREGTYDGPTLSRMAPVDIVSFSDVGTFYFKDNVPVTSGQLYFLRPVLQSGGALDVGYKDSSSYERGQPWFEGLPSGSGDFWFREGIVVPEPSTVAFLGLGVGLGFMWRKLRFAGE